MAGARAGTKATKVIDPHVSGGGRKPWKSERHWARAGGNDPKPDLAQWRRDTLLRHRPRDYSQKVNRKMYRGAMQMHSVRAGAPGSSDGALKISLDLAEPKTKLPERF